MIYKKEMCGECYREGLATLPGQPNVAACPDCGTTREILVALIARRIRSNGSVRGHTLETRDIVTHKLAAMGIADAIEETESILGTKIRPYSPVDDRLSNQYTLDNGDSWTGRFFLFDGPKGDY
jgi:hypothetical protein